MAEFIFDGEEEAQAACKWWQKQLGLSDWDIVCRIKRRWDMEGRKHQGEVKAVIDNKNALVRLLDPVDYYPDAVAEQDQEDTIVHELCHLVLSRVSFDYSTDLEQAIASLTKSLIGFRRLAYPEVPWGEKQMGKKCKGKGGKK